MVLSHIGTTGANSMTGSTSNSKVTNQDCAVPAGVQSGDLMYACINLSGLNVTHTITATGWTQILRVAGGANQGDCFIMRRVAGGSEPSTYNFSWGTQSSVEMSMSVFRGADTVSTPKTASNNSFVSGGATTCTMPSIVGVAAGSMLLTSWQYRNSSGTSDPTFTSPAGSLVFGFFGTGADEGGVTLRPHEIDTVLETGLSAGDTGTRTGSFSINSGTEQVVAVVIEPDAAAPTTGQTWPHGKKGTSPSTGQLFPRGVIL